MSGRIIAIIVVQYNTAGSLTKVLGPGDTGSSQDVRESGSCRRRASEGHRKAHDSARKTVFSAPPIENRDLNPGSAARDSGEICRPGLPVSPREVIIKIMYTNSWWERRLDAVTRGAGEESLLYEAKKGT